MLNIAVRNPVFATGALLSVKIGRRLKPRLYKQSLPPQTEENKTNQCFSAKTISTSLSINLKSKLNVFDSMLRKIGFLKLTGKEMSYIVDRCIGMI